MTREFKRLDKLPVVAIHRDYWQRQSSWDGVVTVTALDGPCIELHTKNAWPHHAWFVLSSSGDVFHPISRGPVLRIEGP